ncbi:MAG: YhbY family RNA-binding protein [Gammaproteobacteria bacterium]
MLSEKHKKQLRRLAHERKPVVVIGEAGLKPSIVSAIDEALDHHELIKIRIRLGSRRMRDFLIGKVCEQSGCELVQRIGFVATLYRRNETETVIDLS